MSAMGIREQREREVLGTICQIERAYEDLPDEFDGSAFEVPEYRRLFELLNAEVFLKNKPVVYDDLKSAYPQMEDVLRAVVWGVTPLNGNLRSQATSLIRHRQEPVSVDEYVSFDGKASLINTPENGEFQFELLNGLEIKQMEIPEAAFFVKDLFTESSLTMLSGEEGCGKSMLALNLAISVAVGAGTWLSHRLLKSGKVIYLNNELPFAEMARRLKTMCDSLPAPGDLSNLIVPKEVPALAHCWQALNKVCEVERPCLIVFDCLYLLHNEDENDSSQMKTLMRLLLALRDRYDLAVIVVHHTKKGSRYAKMHNDNVRGSSVFNAITDCSLQFRRSAKDETKRILKPTKLRNVGDTARECRLLSLNPQTLWFRDEGPVDESEHISTSEPTADQRIDFHAIIKPGEEVSRKDILARVSHLGYDERTIDRKLKEAKNDGILKVPRYGFYSH